jgi:hypothetical protein
MGEVICRQKEASSASTTSLQGTAFSGAALRSLTSVTAFIGGQRGRGVFQTVKPKGRLERRKRPITTRWEINTMKTQPPQGWERVLYANGKDIFFKDFPGIGRYVMRRVNRTQSFRLYLNNKRTTYFGSPDQLVVSVNRVVAQQKMVEEYDKGPILDRT